MKIVLKILLCFNLGFATNQASADNLCRDTTFWLGENPYVMPTKEETTQAILVFEESKKLLSIGKQAQSQNCLAVVTKYSDAKTAVGEKAKNLHADYFGIGVAAGSHLRVFLTCSSESLRSCDAGLDQLQEIDEYLDCVNDTYYQLPR